MTQTKDADGKIIKIGDWVEFKCDVEQSGKIIGMKSRFGTVELQLENENRFDGGYIGGETITWQDADRCWSY